MVRSGPRHVSLYFSAGPSANVQPDYDGLYVLSISIIGYYSVNHEGVIMINKRPTESKAAANLKGVHTGRSWSSLRTIIAYDNNVEMFRAKVFGYEIKNSGELLVLMLPTTTVAKHPGNNWSVVIQ